MSHFVWIAVVISTAIGTALKIAPGAPILGKESQYQRTNKLNYYFSILHIFFIFLMWRICHVETFLHKTDFFSTGITRGTRDKYEVLEVYICALWGAQAARYTQKYC